MSQSTSTCLAALAAAAALASSASAASHLWRFNEVFSNADGTIQFIEMLECCGAPNETVLGGKWIRSGATGMQYNFQANLPCSNCTANEHLLLATAGFAALPGAPQPDYIIPDGFFGTAGDTLTYWFYTDATWTFGPVPLNGSSAMQDDGSIAVNSPTNFAGVSGSVTAPCGSADVDSSGNVDVDDLVAVILAWGPNPGHPADTDDSGAVDVDDLVAVIVAWGTC